MADSWSATPDAKVWTFELNPDATFHDGRKFMAKDAVASLNHHRGENTTSAAAPLLADVTDVKAYGDHTVVIELAQGFADLPWVMTDYHLAMLPAMDDGTIEWESGIGAGPYRIEQNDPGVGANLARHEGWHREGAYFDEVEITILNDPNARQTSLITGDVDAISSVDLKTLALLGRDPNIEIDNVPSGSAITLPMFCDHPPFDNVDVRLALKLAIDREEIVEKILFGTGTPGNDFHVSPNMPYWPDIEQRVVRSGQGQAPPQAGGHGGRSASSFPPPTASFPAPSTWSCSTASRPRRPASTSCPCASPTTAYWADVWLKKPFVFVKWGARPTPDNMFTLAYKGDAPWNEAHWQNDRFNELLLMAKAELDETRRAEMYREMCQLARDDGGTIIPLFVKLRLRAAQQRAARSQRGGQLGVRRRPVGPPLVVRLSCPEV